MLWLIVPYYLLLALIITIKKMMNSYTYLFKYIIIGDPSVGKSCILMQFIDNHFNIDTQTTIGVQFGSKIVDVDTKKIKMQIWDTAGQQLFKSITRSYYRGAIGAILMYDIANKQSFHNLGKWLSETKTYANDKLTVILVGNKNDLEHKRQVSTADAQAFADNNNMIFMECTAKNHELTEEIFFRLAKLIILRIDRQEIDPKNETIGVKLGTYRSKSQEKQTSRLCC